MSATTFSIFIKAPPEEVFPLVGDLLHHPDWATDKMKMKAISSGSMRVASRYRSTTHFKATVIVAELQVVEYQSPARFVSQSTTARVIILTSLHCTCGRAGHWLNGPYSMRTQT